MKRAGHLSRAAFTGPADSGSPSAHCSRSKSSGFSSTGGPSGAAAGQRCPPAPGAACTQPRPGPAPNRARLSWEQNYGHFRPTVQNPTVTGLTRNLPCAGWAPVPLTQNCIPTSSAKGHCLPGFSLSLQRDLTPDLKDDSANNPYLSYIPSRKGNESRGLNYSDKNLRNHAVIQHHRKPRHSEKMEELEEKEQYKELAKSQCGKDKLLQEEDSVLREQAEQIVLSL